MLVNTAAVVGNHAVHLGPEIIHDARHVLSIQGFRQSGETGHIGEQDSGLFALLGRLGLVQ